MPITIRKDLRGLNDLQRRLSELQHETTVSFSELFTDDFMQEYTDFSSIEQMFEASGFKVESQIDLEQLPEDEWNAFVANYTQFADWQEMRSAAAAAGMKGRLGLG